MNRTKFLSVISAIFALIVFSASAVAKPTAKYVFLFIGDGMGTSHVDVTESYLSYKAGKLGGEQLLFTTFPVFGTATNYSANSPVTDSSAAGTAIACGGKTNNSWLGVDPEGNPYESVAEVLKDEYGYKVAVISNVPVNHATPASFYGHNKSRHANYEILKEIPASNFEYFAGAGFMSFAGSRFKPERNISEYLEENGYNVCWGKEELAEGIANGDKIVFGQIYNKQYWKFTCAVISSALGVVITFVPVLGYFYMHGALQDCIYGSYLFNFAFAGQGVANKTLMDWLEIAKYSAPFWLILIFGYLAYKNGWLSGICYSAMLTISSLAGFCLE